jgi:hypothetical protein
MHTKVRLRGFFNFPRILCLPRGSEARTVDLVCADRHAPIPTARATAIHQDLSMGYLNLKRELPWWRPGEDECPAEAASRENG